MVEEDSKNPTHNQKRFHAFGQTFKWAILHKPSLHKQDDLSAYHVSNSDSSHKTHAHIILFIILFVICFLIFLQNCQIVLFIAAQLSSAHRHTLRAMSTCSKAEEKDKAVLAPHTQVCSFSAGPYEKSLLSVNQCRIILFPHNFHSYEETE